MVQTKSNTGLANDPATNTIIRKNANKSNKDNFHSIISKIPQSGSESAPADDHSNILPASKKPIGRKPAGKKSAATEATQRVLGNIILPTTLGTGDPIKVNKNPNYNVSENDEDIAVKIKRLKKKQKKTKIKTKLSRLRKQTTQGFIKDIPEKNIYVQ